MSRVPCGLTTIDSLSFGLFFTSRLDLPSSDSDANAKRLFSFASPVSLFAHGNRDFRFFLSSCGGEDTFSAPSEVSASASVLSADVGGLIGSVATGSTISSNSSR